MKYIEQREVIDLLENSLGKEENLIDNFIVRRNGNKKWEIEFSCKNYPKCKLELRRGKVREFPRLNGVEKFMELVGVREFTVIM